MSTEALARIVRRPARAPEGDAPRCDLCALTLPEHHRHVLDEQRKELMCTCRACTLLFEREAAARGHYRLVPDTRTRLSGVPVDELGVPVGLAFFVPRADGTVIAHFPSPLGTTEHDVEPAAWAAAVRGCPALGALTPQVQALLVNTARSADEQWMVPIDDCYRLVAVIRAEWQGLSGGSTVWPAIESFFGGLGSRRSGMF